MNEASQAVQPRNEAEKSRSDYAIDRTLLANERTYAAWIRTGLMALAAGKRSRNSWLM